MEYIVNIAVGMRVITMTEVELTMSGIFQRVVTNYHLRIVRGVMVLDLHQKIQNLRKDLLNGHASKETPPELMLLEINS